MTETVDSPNPARSWKQSLLLAAAIGGGTLVMAGLVAVVVLLNLPAVSALDLLPANRTIIVMAGESPAVDLLRRAAPGLTLPAAGSGRLLALLSIGEGNEQWINLPRANADTDLTTLPPEVRAVLGQGPSLAAEPLLAAMPHNPEFLFFANAPWLRAKADLHPYVTALLTGRRQVALAAHQGRWQLSTDGGPAGDTLPYSVALGLPVPALSIAAADLSGLLETLQSWQQPDARLITEGLARAIIGRNIGPRVMTGTALTALKDATLVSLAAAGSGATRIALAMDLPPDASASAAQAFEDAFAAALPRATIVRQPLDDEYTLIDARLDESVLDRSDSTQGAWTVVSLSHSGSSRSLGLGLSDLDRRLFVGSDRSTVEGLLPVSQPASALNVLTTDTPLIAGGVLRPAALADMLPPSTPILLTRGLITAWPSTPVISWNLTARNGIWSLIADLGIE